MAAATVISEDITPQIVEELTQFLNRVGVYRAIKPEHNVKDSISNLVGGVLKVISIERGKISCLLHVKAPILVSSLFFFFLFVFNFVCARALPCVSDYLESI